uniref:Spore protein YkvP/CgeB glycosyl transferase-like domain-containing protein n=1 Tax=Nitratidesulfovibrio vulgaris (strain DSM 19637 / Miyazaki F) TaxID=883 RepID=B8DNV9_NITV9
MTGEHENRMPRLFWIGSPFFAQALREEGWQVHAMDFQQVAVFGWQDIVRAAGWEPDVVVVADKSRPPFVLGMESFPCLTVFYCVDSHIHSWYPLYAQAFDVCLMSLRDHIPLVAGRRLPDERIWWTPAFAKDADLPRPTTPEWDLLFVGTVDAARTPARHAFLQRLGQRLPGLHVTRGDYRALYPRGRLLLNYCEHGDLNFRVFEALGCGGCLVTPRIGHGLADLFEDGRDLLLYEPDDIDNLAEVVRTALSDPERCARIAASGLARVDAAHRARHRARDFTKRLRELPQGIVAERRARAHDIRRTHLRLIYLLLAEQMPSPLLREAYLAAAR